MSIKTRLDKLEQYHVMIDSAEDMPEGLSPREQYMWLINAPIPKSTASGKPSRTFSSPQEAYDFLVGKVS